MIDAGEIWKQVQDNSARLRSCSQHFFAETEARIGQKLTCERCGGKMSLTDVGNYIRGFEAAGRPSTEIWPAFVRRSAT